MKRPWTWTVIAVDVLVLVGLAFVYPSQMLSPGALVPAHAELATRCSACHVPFRGATSDRCITCHAVADIGIRSTRGELLARRTGKAVNAAFHQELIEQKCTSCHTDHEPSAQGRFSHELLRPSVREKCETCHTAPANDIHRDLKVSCHQCHTTEHWVPASFDHAALDRAVLERCESCHRPPSDDFHRQITNTCVQCHSPQAWKPSTFDHQRFFVLDGDHNATCVTCHTTPDFKRYTCYGCHEHTPANIRSEHEEEGIRNFENCVECHRSADDEGGGDGERGRGRNRGGDRDRGDDERDDH